MLGVVARVGLRRGTADDSRGDRGDDADRADRRLRRTGRRSRSRRLSRLRSGHFSRPRASPCTARRRGEARSEASSSGTCSQGTFPGPVVPINRRGEAVEGVPGATTLAGASPRVDLALICVPADGVLAAAHDALASGVRSLCVISAGFAEVGSEGAARQEALLDAVRAHGGRLIGPNCLGIASSAHQLNATFAAGAAAARRCGIRLAERCARPRRRRAGACARTRPLGLRVSRQQGRRELQ